ncbi:sulfhydryl oxidase 1 [Megalops cyprinoides]|uniref:sulfhydryl oxidase 1 n=1 Tax=Megalops cyprinoides TaxID=118141 RepID=UPI001864E7DF|nr:sulfhydryl oxidase 1 [Megalops cyprinoides]
MARHRCGATSCCTRRKRTVLNLRSMCIFMSYVYLFGPSAEAGLYTSSDQIVLLNAGNLDSVLFNSTSALVVEFYASWCGHCMAFAPVWKSLARDVREWKPAVDLAAIDCADEGNRMTCSSFGIRGYPTVKFFHAYTKSGSKGQPFKVSSHDVRTLRRQIIDMMETHEESWPPACPPLETASKAEIDNFFETNSVEYLALVFERINSYVGREVTLDLLQYENIAVRRVLSTEDGLVSKMGVTEFPSCYLYYPNGNFSRLNVQIEARTFYSYALQRLPGVVRAGKPQPVVPDVVDNTTGQQWLPFNRSCVYMSDLESALHYSLRSELAAHPTIRGKALTDLKRYVSVLVKYFPGRPVVKNLLQSVEAWLLGLEDTELSYSSLHSVLENTAEIPNAVLPEGVRWVGCQGSQPHFRGYPCSMWTLFHVLTVQAMKTRGSGPQEVLQAMRGYVRSFFGCRECASHFENMAEESMDSVRTLSAATLWLWSRHNRVNNRLAGALSEDPLFPKIQWPPPELCPSCHGVKLSGEHTWKQERVLAFLREHFSSDGIQLDYLEEEAKLLSKQGEKLASLRKEQDAGGQGERKDGDGEAQDTAAEGEEGAQEEPAAEGEEEVEDPAEEEMDELQAADEGRATEPPPWDRPETEPSRHSKPSIVGLKLREPSREDIVDLDSFVNQHYKVKALREASRIKRRSLQRKEELELQPVEPHGFAGEEEWLRKRGLSEEDGEGGMGMGMALDMDLPPYRKRWISLLSVGFSRVDISLCVLLYLLSSMCLLGMYLYFKMRLRLRRAKVALP